MEQNIKYIHLLYVPTMACNMCCKYCYLEENTKDETTKTTKIENQVLKYNKKQTDEYKLKIKLNKNTSTEKKQYINIKIEGKEK